MTIKEAADEINRQKPTFLQRTKKEGYICPFCGQGAHKGRGITPASFDKTRLFCVDCGKSYSTIALYAGYAGIADTRDNYPQIVREAANYYGIRVDDDRTAASVKQSRPAAQPTEPPKQAPQPPIVNRAKDREKWNEQLMQSEKGMAFIEAHYGLTREYMKAEKMGYNPSLGYPKTDPKTGREYMADAAERVVLWYDDYFFKARRIDGKDDSAKYIPSGPGRFLYNPHDAFNDTAPDGRDLHLFPITVVEGEMNAARLIQDGAERVIALGACSLHSLLAEKAAEKNPGAVYILALDNDESGRTAQDKLAAELDAAGIACISVDTAALYGEGSSDACEACQKDLEGFWTRYNKIREEGWNKHTQIEQAAQLAAYFSSGPGMVDAFLNTVKGEAYKPLPTGIADIDRAIGGGLFRQTLVVIGGEPGIGKTAFTSQICESIARAGTGDILYVNLEMSREQLLARSLARIAYKQGNKHVSSLDILQGYRWTIETEEAAYEAADEYKRTVGQHLIYNPGSVTPDLDEIIQKMDDEKKRLGHSPLVVIDYLQLLSGHKPDGRTEEAVDTIKRAMLKLKEWAIRNDSTVILITAHNRESNRDGRVSMSSARDTSAIEYSADVYLALNFTEIEKGNATREKINDLQETNDELARHISLVVLKNRFGQANRKADLVFDGATSLFTPIDPFHDDLY